MDIPTLKMHHEAKRHCAPSNHHLMRDQVANLNCRTCLYFFLWCDGTSDGLPAIALWGHFEMRGEPVEGSLFKVL